MSDELWLEAVSPDGRHYCAVAGDALSVWMYLHASETKSVVGDVVVGSRVLPMTLDEFRRTHQRGKAPPLVREYAAEHPLLHDLAGVTLLWAPDGTSVAALIDGEPTACIVQGMPRGYSRALRVECPWGHAWDDQVFARTFGDSPKAARKKSRRRK